INIVPATVDIEGINISTGKLLCPDARLVYVTPSHQYPLGSAMSIARRLQLLDWAENTGAWILEDDYDSEFRYKGSPFPSLQGLDNNNRVIYTGSFSKVLFPALRLGYIVVPPDLIEPFTSIRAMTDRGNPLIEQAIMSSFIEEGHFYRHIRRMKNLYLERQQILVEEVNKELKGILEISSSDAGMHLIAWLNKNENDQEISSFLSENGIIAPAVSNYCINKNTNPGLILGYT